MATWLKTALGIVGGLTLALLVAYLVGVRIFVIQPIGAIPEGVTAIVIGTPGLNLIDSPDAFCERKQGYVNLLCRAAIAGAVGNKSTILLKLPYSDFLYGLSGAPIVTR